MYKYIVLFLVAFNAAAEEGLSVIDMQSGNGSAVVDMRDAQGDLLNKVQSTVTTSRQADHKIFVTITKQQAQAQLLTPTADVAVNEEEASTVTILARAGARVFVEGYPVGSIWDETTRSLKMWPDFVQSGVYPVTVTAIDTGTSETATDTFNITVTDSVALAPPAVINTSPGTNFTTYTLEFTDQNKFLGDDNRRYEIKVTAPNNASASNKLPVRILLHGGGGGGTPTTDPDGRVRITNGSAGLVTGSTFSFGPAEEGNSSVGVRLHTGAQTDWPAAATGAAQFNEGTQRRILYVLDWMTRNIPGVDTNRVSTIGSSMGGTGGMFMLARYGYKFTKIDTKISGNGPKHHANSTFQNQISSYWGDISGSTVNNRGVSAWDLYDTAGAVMNSMSATFDRSWAKQVYIKAQNGVLDTSSSFRNWTKTQANIGTYFLDALQQSGTPHHLCWDQQGHGNGDAALLAEGYSTFWCGDKTAASYTALRLNKAYVAFSNSSIDHSPPIYNPATTNTFDLDPNADLRGGFNRHLTWDNASVVDTHSRFEIDLSVTTEAVDPSQNPAYPAPGEGWQGALPITADVTLRREQKFIGLPGEIINWQFGAQSGQLTVAADRDIKVTGLQLTGAAQKLILTRVGW